MPYWQYCSLHFTANYMRLRGICLLFCYCFWNNLGIAQFLHWQYLQRCSKNSNRKTCHILRLLTNKSHQDIHTLWSAIGHVNNILTIQYRTRIPRNTQSISYTLSLAECVWEFWNNGLLDTHYHALLLWCKRHEHWGDNFILVSPHFKVKLYFLHLYLWFWLFSTLTGNVFTQFRHYHISTKRSHHKI